MSSVNFSRFLLGGACVGVLGGAAAPRALATPIVWSTPQTITGDGDVSTSGTLLYAYNVGDQTVTSETINGVTFAPFDASNTTFPTGTATHGSATLSGIDPTYNGAGPDTGSKSAPFTSLSSSYQALLTQVAFAKAPSEAGGPVNLVLTLGGLTVGNTYQFETWSNDSRASQGGSAPATRSETITDGTNTSAPLEFNSSPPVEGGLGSFITGTFVASATTETLTYVGNPSAGDAQVNAFQVRDISPSPEPGATALLGIGAVGALTRRRRK